MCSSDLPPLSEQRPGLPGELCSIVDRLLAKSPLDRYATPLELLHAVEAAESVIAPRSRLMPSPLSWTEGDPDLVIGDGGDPRMAAAMTVDTRAQATAEMRKATQQLQAAVERERRTREETRRRWLATAAVAAAVFGLGFLWGRWRARRSDLFRTRR